MKWKIIIPFFALIIGLLKKYPALPEVSLKYMLIWIIGTSLLGVVLPFLIYAASYSNKTIYTNEKDIADKRIIKPKWTSFYMGVSFLAFGLGLLVRNSFDLITSGLVFFGLFAIIGSYLFSAKKQPR